MKVKTEKMKVLMAGLGGIGQRHVRNLRVFFGENVDLLAYRVRGSKQTLTDTLKIEEGVDLEKKYEIAPYRELEAALDQKPDVVFVTNPSSLHMEVALRAAERGCHLFIEKPLSHSLDGTEELISLVEKEHLMSLVGYPLRFHPGLKQVYTLLEQKAIGSILSARLMVGEYLPNWHTYEDYRKIYASRDELGGGAILSQIHEFDYAYWFFGMPRRLFTLGGKLSHLEVDVEDTASTLMECPFEGRGLPVHVTQDFVQRPSYRTCEIFGEEGRILWDYHAGCVQLFSSKNDKVRAYSLDGFVRNQLFMDELKHFFACVEGKERPVVDVQEGVKSLKIALAARRSLETGEVVAID